MSASGNVFLQATKVHAIKSASTTQSFAISVALPSSYSSRPRTFYATIYLLDANFHFGLVTELTRYMALDGELPETLVVGVGYPSRRSLKATSDRAFLLRSYDLTPIRDLSEETMVGKWLKVKKVATGGAESLVSMLRDQLMPFIERRYRSDSTRRVIVGHSFGGLFTLHALFSDHRLFKGYVAASPSLWYGERIMFRREEDYAGHHSRLPVHLFLAAGDREDEANHQMASNVVHFAAKLRSRRYAGLQLSTALLPDCGHSASVASAYQVGLHSVLVQGRAAT
jgi:predicted alpha/beta superfamily hydrolase